MARLSDWIRLFSSLTSLDLPFDPRLLPNEISSISQGLHIDGMATVILCFVSRDYYDLAILLKNNRKALRRFALYDVDLYWSCESMAIDSGIGS